MKGSDVLMVRDWLTGIVRYVPAKDLGLRYEFEAEPEDESIEESQ